MARILVCGGRDYNNQDVVNGVLDWVVVNSYGLPVLIEGGARGADYCARTWALSRNAQYIEEPANWGRYGKAAGSIRNQAMLDKHSPHLCVAFPGGRGTADMISRCRSAGVPVIEVTRNGVARVGEWRRVLGNMEQ